MPTSSPHSSHLDNSLVFQFILSHFFLVRSELANISQLITQLQENQNSSILDISKATSRLVGASQVEMRIYDWSGDGILTKFKEYCAQFALMHSGKKNKDAESLLKSVTELWHIGLKTQDFVSARLKSNLNSSFFTDIIRTKNKMSALLEQISEVFTRIFILFNQDENVIFFLLRNYEEFSELYGAWFFNDLFDKMFENGAAEAKQFLIDSYTKRGFSQLIPVINLKFNEILSNQACVR